MQDSTYFNLYAPIPFDGEFPIPRKWTCFSLSKFLNLPILPTETAVFGLFPALAQGKVFCYRLVHQKGLEPSFSVPLCASSLGKSVNTNA